MGKDNIFNVCNHLKFSLLRASNFVTLTCPGTPFGNHCFKSYFSAINEGSVEVIEEEKGKTASKSDKVIKNAQESLPQQYRYQV
jgi:hypothetical protein